MLQGIGERFGSSFDDVRRDPRPALVAVAFDALVLGLLAVAVALGGGDAPRAAYQPFAVAGALPTFTDVVDVSQSSLASVRGERGLWVAAAMALALAPLAAWLEGGVIGMLKAAYVDRDEGPLGPRFRDAARRAFAPLLAYRILLHGGLVAGVAAGVIFPRFHHEAVGAIVLEFVLLFTPFFVVLEGETAWGGMKRSAAAVADHLATCLVTLLFLLLVTGGASALAARLASFLGGWAVLPVAAIYAPVGTALSVFVLKVWLSFRPADLAPARAAPAAAPAGS